MSVRRKTSILVLAVSAFVAGILFTTAGANLFERGDQIGTAATAKFVEGDHSPQAALVEPSAAALSMEKTFTEVAERVNPAVVQIRSEKVQQRSNPLQGTPFEDFFGERAPEEFRSDALGSGVIVRDDGYIVTNNHVIDGADDLEVKLFDGRFAEAEVVGTDSRSDLAVIKINESDLPTLPYGDMSEVRVGQWVMAFGSPLSLDLSNSVTAGIVSAIGRTSRQLSALNLASSFIQTDAAINPGNSGGALVNLYGQLVGINTAILSRSGGSQGVGLSIPVDIVSNVVTQLIEDGEVSRGFLGVTFGPISASLSRAMDVPRGAAQVTDVVDDSPADKAGLRVGDIIIAVDGEELLDENQLRVIIGNHLPGDTVDLDILRDDRRRNISVELGRLDTSLLAANTPTDDGDGATSMEGLGVSLGDVTRSTLQSVGIDPDTEDLPSSGVLILNIDQNSDAFRDAELRRGDIITEVNRKAVSSLADFESVYKDLDSGEDFILRVARTSAAIGGGASTQNLITALRKP